MSTVTYRQAINLALADALDADERVFLLGEDIAAAGGVFKVTDGLMDRVGDGRVLDTPISEQAIIGAAIGASIKGLRPVAELMFADFAGVCFDQIANQLAKYRYMSGGQVTLPVTVRLVNGAGGGFASQHSQTVESWFLNVPGLKMAVPATPADAYGLLRAAIADDDPVLFFEHKSLYNQKAQVNALRAPVPLGRAAVVRPGQDVTVVATQLMRLRAEEAAAALDAEGISIEVVDPRTVAPLDLETVGASLGRTRRLVVVQEGPLAGSWGATLIAGLVGVLPLLDGPPVVVGSDDTPVPYAGSLEGAWLPDVERIAARIRQVVKPV